MDNHKYISYIKIYGSSGSLQHYYHFFFGVLIPLILEYVKYKKKYDNCTFIIKDDVGPFFRILFDLPIDIKLDFFFDTSKFNIEQKWLIPLDTQLFTDKNILMIKRKYADIFTNSLRIIINKWFIEQINTYNFYVHSNYNMNNIDILIIERKINISFKTSYSKNIIRNENKKLYDFKKKSGAERRYIINHSKFVKFIKDYFPKKNVINISTEYMSIFEQFYLFHNAKLVIAQHGAALANIIFMKNKSSVIELIHKEQLSKNWFLNLSKECDKLKYMQYITNEENPVIDLEKFKLFLDDNHVLHQKKHIQ